MMLVIKESFLKYWLLYRESLRISFFYSPSRHGTLITPAFLLSFFLLNESLHIGIQRAYISGPAMFYPNAFMWGGWVTLAVLWLCWLAQKWSGNLSLGLSISTLFAVVLGQDILFSLIDLITYEATKLNSGPNDSLIKWAVFLSLATWAIASSTVFLIRATGASKKIGITIALCQIGIYALIYLNNPPWYWYAKNDDKNEDEYPSLNLSQATFEHQLSLANVARESLSQEQSGIVDLYAITFAPYQDQVFLNESFMVKAVLEEKFGAAHKFQTLINHTSTTETTPWATLENLERAINAAADKMNRDEDILLIYLTSHGGKNGHLSSEFWPLALDNLTPSALNLMLDKANIKHRIIIVSACYSGSWIGPLQNDNTLIMTAADATHTSYGCGYKSELTYFGKALFDEQLRKTKSFTQAFKQAVPIIKAREEKAKKDDGFSNPQIVMGKNMPQILNAFEAHLGDK